MFHFASRFVSLAVCCVCFSLHLCHFPLHLCLFSSIILLSELLRLIEKVDPKDIMIYEKSPRTGPSLPWETPVIMCVLQCMCMSLKQCYRSGQWQRNAVWFTAVYPDVGSSLAPCLTFFKQFFFFFFLSYESATVEETLSSSTVNSSWRWRGWLFSQF